MSAVDFHYAFISIAICLCFLNSITIVEPLLPCTVHYIAFRLAEVPNKRRVIICQIKQILAITK